MEEGGSKVAKVRGDIRGTGLLALSGDPVGEGDIRGGDVRKRGGGLADGRSASPQHQAHKAAETRWSQQSGSNMFPSASKRARSESPRPRRYDSMP